MKLNKIKGAGDIVEVALKSVGITKGTNCKCKKRQEFLNRLIKNPLHKEGTDGD
tara:strand:+ start:815 stop:976 length:162 start_codon:yes stop_codon:yes gene_type:complete